MVMRTVVLVLLFALNACASARRAPRHEAPVVAPPASAVQAARVAAEEDEREAPAVAPAPAAPQGKGPWRVAVVSVRTPEEAAAYVQRLQGAGYRVEIEAAFVGGTSWQRIVLPGYARYRDAEAAVAAVNAQLKGARAWVVPPPKPATSAS